MKVVLICGPYGSGTTAVAGLLSRIGAIGFNRNLHWMTTDPRTPDSYELTPFRDIVLQFVDEANVALKGAAPAEIQSALQTLRLAIERQAFGPYDLRRHLRRPPWVALKHPLAAFLIPQICQVFETKAIHVMRPLEQIEQTRLRRGWPANYGAAGAEIIYQRLDEAWELAACPAIKVEYAALVASPLAHARRIARLVGLTPSMAQMQQAVSFVKPRPV